MTKKINFQTPEFFFLLFAIIFGVAYCIAVPYGAGFDEEAHMVRIYDISGYNFFPNRNPPTYRYTLTLGDFHNLSYQRRDFNNSAQDMFTSQALSHKLDKSEENLLYRYTTNSIYSPVMFLPQAVIGNILWRRLDLPFLPVVMLMRISGLLMYAIGGYLTIRMLPFGKWAMTVLALSPMALYQAATLNTDGFTIASSFLFIGMVLYLWAHPPYQPAALAGLVISMALLGSAKPGSIVLLPLLLVLSLKNFTGKRWILLALAGIALAVILNLGWSWLALATSRYGSGSEKSVSGQIARVLQDVPAFILASYKGLSTYYLKYLRNWIASYGYWVGTVPAPVFWIFPIALVAAFLHETRKEAIPARIRLVIFGVFLLSAAAIVGLYFTMHYSHGNVGTLRQGRYIIPYIPLFFLALSGLARIPENLGKYLPVITISAVTLVLGFYSFGLYATYFTDCGYPAFIGQGCTLPNYKNLDTFSTREIKVNGETVLRQSFAPACTGMQNVQVKINSIPEGSSGGLKMSLLDADGKLLSSGVIPLENLEIDEYAILPLGTPIMKKGGNYWLVLEAPTIQAPDGIGVEIKGEDVFAGELFQNDQPVKDDVLFRYGCTGP